MAGKNLEKIFRENITSRAPEAWTALERLVACNSLTGNASGVDRCGGLVREMFRDLGFHERIIRSKDHDRGSHVILTHPGQGSHEIVLVSHLDTVYSSEEEEANEFRWREEAGRIYGPGVIDIKGGIVMIHLVLRVLAESAPRLFEAVGWRVLLNAAEETGSEDFPALAREQVGPHTLACLVFEHGHPRGDRASSITVSRRGCGRFRIEAQGRQAHSGSGHHRGASAISEIARLITLIENSTDPAKGLTFNVGVVRGGSVINSVPDQAIALVDMRADDPDVFAQAVRKIQGLAGEGSVRSRSDGFPCQVKVTTLPAYPPWPGNPGSKQLAEVYQSAAESLGSSITAEHRLGASDGCHLWDLAPTLDGLGPLGENIHCAKHDPPSGKYQESLIAASLEERAMLNLLALAALIEGSRGSS